VNELLAVLWLRRRLAVHSLSGLAGAVNVAAGVALAAAAAVGALAVAAALGVIVHLAATSGSSEAVGSAWSITAYTVAFFALGVPIIVGAGTAEFDAARLLRFPLSRRLLYHLSLASDATSRVHLAWYPALAVAAVAGLPSTVAGAAGSSAVLIVYAVLLVCWSHSVLLVIRRFMRHRRFREIAAVVGLAALVALCLLPAVIDLSADDADLQVERLFTVPDRLVSASSVLPPSIAARGLVAAVDGRPEEVGGQILRLAIWLAVGWAAGRIAFDRLLRSDPPAGGGNHTGPIIATRIADLVVAPFPTAVGAVAAKELRYLLRSGVGKLSLLLMPAMTALPAVLTGRYGGGTLGGLDLDAIVFTGLMLYAATLTGYLQVNAFAWDGTALAAIFSSPVPSSDVILGKNLALWCFNLVLAAEALVVWVPLRGVPQATVLAGGFTVFATTSVLLSLLGNLTSIAHPVARPIEAVTSAASPVGTMVVIGCVAAGAVSLGIATTVARVVGASGLAPVLALGFFIAVLALYRAFLGVAARTLDERRDDVLHALGSG
jgi:hypothetical protein